MFIQAGSGGVGTVAVQLARHLGATVATTASTTSFGMLRNLGADILIDYRTQDFGQERAAVMDSLTGKGECRPSAAGPCQRPVEGRIVNHGGVTP